MMLEASVPALDWVELKVWLLTPLPAETGPVAALVFDALTPDPRLPLLLWELAIDALVNSPALATRSPFTPLCGRPLLAEFALVLDAVEPEVFRMGDDVLAVVPLTPVLPVAVAVIEQFTCR